MAIDPKVDSGSNSCLARTHPGISPVPEKDARGRDVLELPTQFVSVWSANGYSVLFHEGPEAFSEIDHGRVMADCKVVDVGEKQPCFWACGHFPDLPVPLDLGIGQAPGLNGDAGPAVGDLPVLTVRLWKRPHGKEALHKEGMCEGQILAGDHRSSNQVIELIGEEFANVFEAVGCCFSW